MTSVLIVAAGLGVCIVVLAAIAVVLLLRSSSKDQEDLNSVLKQEGLVVTSTSPLRAHGTWRDMDLLIECRASQHRRGTSFNNHIQLAGGTPPKTVVQYTLSQGEALAGPAGVRQIATEDAEFDGRFRIWTDTDAGEQLWQDADRRALARSLGRLGGPGSLAEFSSGAGQVRLVLLGTALLPEVASRALDLAEGIANYSG